MWVGRQAPQQFGVNRGTMQTVRRWCADKRLAGISQERGLYTIRWKSAQEVGDGDGDGLGGFACCRLWVAVSSSWPHNS